MVDVYATLIINKRRTFDSVPAKLQDDVKARLKELGYDTDGNPIPVNNDSTLLEEA